MNISSRTTLNLAENLLPPHRTIVACFNRGIWGNHHREFCNEFRLYYSLSPSHGGLRLASVRLFGGLDRATVVEPRGGPGEHHQGGHHPAQGTKVQILNEGPEDPLPPEFRCQ